MHIIYYERNNVLFVEVNLKHILDNVDLNIVNVLEKKGRTSFAKLSEEVGISKSPCWARVQTLQKVGVIRGYHADVCTRALGLQIKAMIHVTVKFSESSAFEKSVLMHPNVVKCSAVTGDYDYVVDVISQDIESFDKLLRQELSSLPGVERFSTSVVTREVKNPNEVSLASLMSKS